MLVPNGRCPCELPPVHEPRVTLGDNMRVAPFRDRVEQIFQFKEKKYGAPTVLCSRGAHALLICVASLRVVVGLSTAISVHFSPRDGHPLPTCTASLSAPNGSLAKVCRFTDKFHWHRSLRNSRHIESPDAAPPPSAPNGTTTATHSQFQLINNSLEMEAKTCRKALRVFLHQNGRDSDKRWSCCGATEISYFPARKRKQFRTSRSGSDYSHGRLLGKEGTRFIKIIELTSF